MIDKAIIFQNKGNMINKISLVLPITVNIFPNKYIIKF